MQRSLEQILDSILHASEILEDDLKQDSALKKLTQRQLYCLELIQNLQNPSLSELAEQMNIAKASISVMIDRMEKNDFIRKIASDSDRRSAHIHLTPKGAKAAELHTEVHRKIAQLLTADMTDSEKEILIVLLNKSVKSLTKRNNS
jgi:DNA-binding MarR family transcriptional regulator